MVYMVAAALMWSMAGVVARQLQSASGFEVNVWRSGFNALALTVLLLALRGVPGVQQAVQQGGRAMWLSGVCWAVMFTAFMMALTLTTVANVLVTMALAPLATAIVARLVFGQRLPVRTGVATLAAALGITMMFASSLQGADPRHWWGTIVAAGVPLAAAVNWSVLRQKGLAGQSARSGDGFLAAVWVGALLSALVTLPLAWPLKASLHDVQWLAFLGVFQLAVPCWLAVRAAQALEAPEVALLSLLEVIFGIAWAWWLAGEAITRQAAWGAGLVLLALAGHEALGLWARGKRGQPTRSSAQAPP
jgi:drug/metabolite transporter (DMT)-like permease